MDPVTNLNLHNWRHDRLSSWNIGTRNRSNKRAARNPEYVRVWFRSTSKILKPRSPHKQTNGTKPWKQNQRNVHSWRALFAIYRPPLAQNLGSTLVSIAAGAKHRALRETLNVSEDVGTLVSLKKRLHCVWPMLITVAYKVTNQTPWLNKDPRSSEHFCGWLDIDEWKNIQDPNMGCKKYCMLVNPSTVVRN